MNQEWILAVCAVLTLMIAVVAVILTIRNRREMTRVVRALGVCVFLMLMALIYPYYAGQPYALGLTLVESMCAMLLNTSPSEILAGFEGFAVSYIGLYKAVLLVILIVAPLFTVGITLSFFSDKFNRILYRIRSEFKDTYLFSAINERTLCIAEDIAENHSKAVIVFVLRISENDISAEDMARINAIHACVIGDDIAQLRHSLRHKRNYYLLSTDSGENLDTGLRLYRKYNAKKTDKVNMWLYTKSELAEVIFDQLYETFNVRLINEEGLIAKALVTDHPLYEGVKDGKLSVLLVGGGHIGLEILRSVSMCACLGDGVESRIDVIDLNAEKAQQIFEKDSPGLAEYFGITFHSADIKTERFTKLLSGIQPTYVILALGNETLNMETALYIRRYYGIEDGMPKIHVLADHKSLEEQIVPNLCVSTWTYNSATGHYVRKPICDFDLQPFGCYEDTYKNLRIGATYRDCLAVAMNAARRGISAIDAINTPARLTDLYNQVSFYKDFSDAYAVSIPYKLYLMGLELVADGQGDLSALEESLPRYEEILRQHENRRFEAFMRGKGWTQMLPGEVDNVLLRDKLRKRHARLTLQYTEVLEEMTGRDFREEDLRSIRGLPATIRLANILYGKNYSVRRRLYEYH
ncbi:MAG: hypothetical protein IJO72_02805 [Oscillospiraceae bacterium]|nr:hypothetical protein [Oscillospiraceae bacterium]